MQPSYQNLALDEEGYLLDLNDWSESLATEIAEVEGIELTDAHWDIIYLLRDFYKEFEVSPAMRPLVKAVSKKLGADKGKSIYLMTLFPGSPPKLGAKIAGLPKPANCL
ncbi:TusE/DsrC/DsvC family sulfur relay protein [Marinomonas mediterranea]|jgi:sulfur relay protein, TusE/DsrC/DsvC family|uniref:Sulfurtransferase n=1 Tax=Marinomonas mediterranea (strain ATCC 700492 / JCM 21426 / NBRC 103028 / MMB-1) TaxID=717774 RepID=F2JZ70_MARM1|nr:TusE/DsrC/DsvC family sulfur relay protein [Marinomonas mediterranea]ADZ92048.1 sulfur relay protein, TusE/DsrC/DsvC family [Marinomonas mediterranea MMB-1]WCN10014.1 TusE/DsrC/DsvC family sulfur relay protein [Marinomonas mediterranea]WCN18120.1 TusE/DsrC/DsvC family sulfur relay protein [Marinomonas mediterranea MMB-1]